MKGSSTSTPSPEQSRLPSGRMSAHTTRLWIDSSCPSESGPPTTRRGEAMTKREEPWSVEDDWIAEEERWFKQEGSVYYPWAIPRWMRWARLASVVVLAALVLLGLWGVWAVVPRWTVPDASEADLREVPA